MAWEGPSVMEKKEQFVQDWLEGTYSKTELCKSYGISRPTGYKVIERFKQEGLAGLQEKSRAPHHQPHAVSPTLRDQIVQLRERYPHLGPKKLRVLLQQQGSQQACPSASTIGEILKRVGLVVSRKRKRRACPSSVTVPRAATSNQIWCIDFKGKIRSQDGRSCYPLTVLDEHSRFVLCCQGLQRMNGAQVQAVLARLFREYGLPTGIRSDNGPPFASVGLGGLSRLAVWWIKLGIEPIRIQPGCPAQNGRQERMHRTLNEWIKHHPVQHSRHFAKAFAGFLEEYNGVRPHEALGQVPPAHVYEPSSRPYPGRVSAVAYPYPVKARRVKPSGEFSWQSRHWYLSEALAGELVGLEEQDERHVDVYFSHYRLGYFNPRKQEKRRVISASTLQTIEEWEDQKSN